MSIVQKVLFVFFRVLFLLLFGFVSVGVASFVFV